MKAWRDRLAVVFRADAPFSVYLGLVLVAAGFVLLAVTWGDVAGYLDVGDQVPYLVSGGCAGLGLIVVGVAALAIAVMRSEAARRQRSTDQLLSVVQELRAELQSRPAPPEPAPAQPRRRRPLAPTNHR
jgi:hypothetical protein